MGKKKYFWIGIGVLIFLLVGFFIKIPLNENGDVIIDSLLGLIIFHNPFILAIYILIALVLIIKSFKK